MTEFYGPPSTASVVNSMLNEGQGYLNGVAAQIAGDPVALRTAARSYRSLEGQARTADSRLFDLHIASGKYWNGPAAEAFRAAMGPARSHITGTTQPALIELANWVDRAADAIEYANKEMNNVLDRYRVAASVYRARARGQGQDEGLIAEVSDKVYRYWIPKGGQQKAVLGRALLELAQRFAEIQGRVEAGTPMQVPTEDAQARERGAAAGDTVHRALNGDASPEEFRAAMEALAARVKAIKDAQAAGKPVSAADIAFVNSFLGSLSRDDIRGLHGYITAKDHGSVLFGLFGGEAGFDSVTQRTMTRDLGDALVLAVNDGHAPPAVKEILDRSAVDVGVSGFASKAGVDNRVVDGFDSGWDGLRPFLREAEVAPNRELSELANRRAHDIADTIKSVPGAGSYAAEAKERALDLAQFAAKNEGYVRGVLADPAETSRHLAPLHTLGPPTAQDTALLKRYFDVATSTGETVSLVRTLADSGHGPLGGDGMGAWTHRLVREQGDAAVVLANGIAPHLGELAAGTDPRTLPDDTYYRFVKAATATQDGYDIVFDRSVKDADKGIDDLARQVAAARTDGERAGALAAFDKKMGVVGSELAVVAGASAGSREEFLKAAVDRANGQADVAGAAATSGLKTAVGAAGEAAKNFVVSTPQGKIVVSAISALAGSVGISAPHQDLPQFADHRSPTTPATTNGGYRAADALMSDYFQRYERLTHQPAVATEIDQIKYLMERNALAARMSSVYDDARQTAVNATDSGGTSSSAGRR